MVAVSGVDHDPGQQPGLGDDPGGFGPHEAEVLLQMTRQLYPHDRLGDIYYAEVVEALDAKAKAAPELVELVKNGVAALDQAKHVPFLQLSDGHQTEVLAGHGDRAVLPDGARPHGRGALQQQGLVERLRLPGQLLAGRRLSDAAASRTSAGRMQPDAEASPPPFLG